MSHLLIAFPCLAAVFWFMAVAAIPDASSRLYLNLEMVKIFGIGLTTIGFLRFLPLMVRAEGNSVTVILAFGGGALAAAIFVLVFPNEAGFKFGFLAANVVTGAVLDASLKPEPTSWGRSEIYLLGAILLISSVVITLLFSA